MAAESFVQLQQQGDQFVAEVYSPATREVLISIGCRGLRACIVAGHQLSHELGLSIKDRLSHD